MRYRWLIAASLLIAVAVATYLWWPRSSQASVDPRIAEMFQTQQKPLIEKLIAAESNLERIQIAGQLQKSVAELSETDRRQLFEYGRREGQQLRQAFVQREQNRVEKYFQLTRDEQIKALDKHIDEMEAMRNIFGNLGGRGATAGSKGAGPPFGPGMGPPPPAMAGRESADPSMVRQQMAQRMLNNTTPEFRAQMHDYMQQLSERRDERGLPAMRLPGM